MPDWMVWNLALALVPVALSWPLFRGDRHPSGWVWWVGAATFLAFLPNAPYVLTDVIHFARAVRGSESDLYVAFGIIPKYAVLFGVGFGSYVVAVVRLERWLRRCGWSLPRVLGVDLTVHALCAVGVLLGRVYRFNSWDLVARPGDVLSVAAVPRAESAVLLVAAFLVLAGGTAFLRALAGLGARLAPAR